MRNEQRSAATRAELIHQIAREVKKDLQQLLTEAATNKPGDINHKVYPTNPGHGRIVIDFPTRVS